MDTRTKGSVRGCTCRVSAPQSSIFLSGSTRRLHSDRLLLSQLSTEAISTVGSTFSREGRRQGSNHMDKSRVAHCASPLLFPPLPPPPYPSSSSLPPLLPLPSPLSPPSPSHSHKQDHSSKPTFLCILTYPVSFILFSAIFSKYTSTHFSRAAWQVRNELQRRSGRERGERQVTVVDATVSLSSAQAWLAMMSHGQADLCFRSESKKDSKVKEGIFPFAGVSRGKVQSRQLARRDATNFLDR